jgi:16S rRNA (guanine1516-N2)-methyltransferase
MVSLSFGYRYYEISVNFICNFLNKYLGSSIPFLYNTIVKHGNGILAIAVYATGPEQHSLARNLAEKLSIPLIKNESLEYRYLLISSPNGLALKQTGKNNPGPIMVDFTSGSMQYRLRHGGGRNQALARAIGLKKGWQPAVIDATAGLGRDAVVLAYLGCHVHMIERSPILAALLEDGLQRAAGAELTAETVRSRLSFCQADSRDILYKLSQDELPDVIYLDPMYPERTKSSLAKKEMRILRELTGGDRDAAMLLRVALERTRNRVVVKRPRQAPPLNDKSPSHEISGKTSRFDVYLI